MPETRTTSAGKVEDDDAAGEAREDVWPDEAAKRAVARDASAAAAARLPPALA